MAGQMKKPELEDFGVTPEQYAFYVRMGNKDGPSGAIALIASTITVSIVVLVLLLATGDKAITGWSAFGSLFVVAPVATFLIDALIVRYNRWRLLIGPVISRIKQYEAAEVIYRAEEREAWSVQREAERQKREAEREGWESEREVFAAFLTRYKAGESAENIERRQREYERARQAALLAEQRKREQYWESLGGVEFERELGRLFGARGYRVEFTPTIGDQGIDLVLRKNGKTTVVQCKAHNRPVGPAVARELYGSMVAYKADNAILACTGGFTDGVYKFAQGKPIRLISSRDIARVAEATGGEVQDTLVDGPICPNEECGRTMVLRKGYRGRFWGCPRYPACRGTRQL